ncbi:ATP-, maltotriose-and DNA-dependent transcriptional regulator MalT [Solimonas aquatica]|uniref:ATP-, maltotriose-and DNA-dependent transcriptional regulator MalT n=1 Tax=Solimonas aquatica TaxID=489703 RepID=A0A1H9FSY8_9GAMM|nr:LuxR C-terminal-related transcriptional regulator [Solimonas aquatica]SEQ41007.1 ATP-, maltotriose-and DNA-dependent transcriptional regulator MalT [Solimonas aquatica]
MGRRGPQESGVAADKPSPGNLRYAIARARLANVAPAEPIVLIEAPAGYGKTTLINQQLQATPADLRTLVITLGAEHRDATVLLRELLERLGGEAAGPAAARADAADLFLQFTKIVENPSQCHRLFFDDVHLLEGSPSIRYLNRLLHGAGPNLRFVLSARDFRESSLSISEFSAAGMVRRIGAQSLAMTEEEALCLAAARSSEWAPEQVKALVRSTQGWPVLLQLALSGQPTTIEPMSRTISDVTPIRQYIEDRFLSKLDDDELRLLAVLAIDDIVPLQALNALAIKAPEAVLFALERLGIVQRRSGGPEGECLSVHPILRESILRSASGRVAPQLHAFRRDLAQWWYEQADIHRAVGLAADAGDRERAAGWLRAAAEALVFLTGRHQTFLDLLQRCEPLSTQQRDELEQFAVWALIFQHRHADAEQRLMRARSVSEDAGQVVILQRATIAAMCDDYSSAAAFAEEWLRSDCHNDFQEGAARVIVAFKQKCQCQFDEATHSLSRARALFARTSSHYGLSWVHVVSLLNLLKAGRHRHARAEVATSLRLAAGEGGLSNLRAMLLGIQSMLHYERDELAQARAALEDCLPALPDQGIVDAIVCGYVTAARLRCADGDLGSALDLLAEGERMGVHRGFPRMAKAIAAERVLSLLRAGALDQAELVARDAFLTPDSADPVARDRAGRLFARLALLRGEPRRALALIEPILLRARNTGQQFKLCECLLLAAIAHFDSGNAVTALEQLQEAFELGEVEAYFRVYLDEYPLLSPLLEVYASERQARASAIAAQLRESVSPARKKEQLDALSKREIQIVKLLAEGISNAEIARRCFLGEGTVKWYLHNIYGKLDVRGRTAAVRAAQRAGLI